MLILKHLKTLQHVSIIIQIIFRDTHTPNVMLPHHHNWPFTFLNF